MAYFPDLSPYANSDRQHLGVVHVGWLDDIHPFPKGHVAPNLIEKMKSLATKPVNLFLGYHYCEICVAPPDVVKSFLPNWPNRIDPNCSWAKWRDQRRSNGEARVAYEGVTFAAPVLIVHYIEEHGYLPPTQFLV